MTSLICPALSVSCSQTFGNASPYLFFTFNGLCCLFVSCIHSVVLVSTLPYIFHCSFYPWDSVDFSHLPSSSTCSSIRALPPIFTVPHFEPASLAGAPWSPLMSGNRLSEFSIPSTYVAREIPLRPSAPWSSFHSMWLPAFFRWSAWESLWRGVQPFW